ncbi:4a-hydroxytetrahydrobiopterin dehydratase [Opitutaceae bacterium]|nr:4a-hydroxytetrahydrobiopterin dehydratase [Opitutaceae bacterium]
MNDTPLTDAEIDAAIACLGAWNRSGDQLHKLFSFPDFKSALAFMVRAGFEAESRDHHPEWTNVYNRVEVRLCTHSAGAKITEKDVNLATAFDGVAAQFR